jgi:hypothetical protein
MKDTEYIRDFSQGISDDVRLKSGYAFTKHFNTTVTPNVLTPYPSTSANETAASGGASLKENLITRFQYVGGKLWGLGIKTGGTLSKIWKQVDAHNGTGWDVDYTLEDSTDNTVANFPMFTTYDDYVYGYGGQYIWRAGDLTGTPTFTSRYKGALSAVIVSACDGYVHPTDNVLYGGYNNIVWKINGATFTDSALTLGTNYQITSLCRYGNYLAISVIDKNDSYSSKVILWDRDSTLADVDKIIDFGSNGLMVLDTINETLVGVAKMSPTSFGGENQTGLIIKVFNGIEFITIKEVPATGNFNLQKTKQVKNNILYFSVDTFTTSEGTLNGIWAVRRNGNTYSVNLEIIEPDVAVDGGIQSFYNVGDYWWISHSDDGSIQKTVAGANSYLGTFTYQSNIFSLGDPSITKKLIGVTVTTKPLPSGASYTLKYRINEESSYTTIFTESTDNSISHSSINIESAGTILPQFKEIQFQLTGTGKTEITGIDFTYEIIDNLSYQKWKSK